MIPQTIRGSIRRGQGAIVRAEIVDDRLTPINRDTVEHIRITLHRKGGELDTPLHEWAPSYQDTIYDAPQTSVNDPGWTYDRGYNFRWKVPGFYLSEVRTYTLHVTIFMRDQDHAEILAEITVLAGGADG